MYCSHVSVDDVLETLIPLEYIGQMRSITAEYSRDTKRQSTQRKQRLRAVRAFIVSERNQKVIEGLTRNGGNTSFIWDNEKFNFARWFLHDGMYGGERTRTCLTDLSPNSINGGLFSWCDCCEKDVLLCKTCFQSSDGNYEIIIANAFGDSAIAAPQCVHAILHSSFSRWGVASREDFADRVIDLIKE